jgi:hemoglobin
MMSARTKLGVAAVCLLLAVVAAGCSEMQGMSASKATLYDRLGGEPAITAVVGDFVDRAAGDPKVNFTRRGTEREWQATPENVDRLKKSLTQFVCMASGGPQKYYGRDMKSTHRGMNILDGEFDALAANLRASLTRFNVPTREQDELITIVGSTRKDIVESTTR